MTSSLRLLQKFHGNTLKFTNNGTQWIVKNLSRANNLIYEQTPVKEIQLQKGDCFSVKDFEFEFNQEGLLSKKAETDQSTNALDPLENTVPIALSSDQTSVGHVVLQPRLKVVTKDQQKEKVYALKAQTCVIGRDESCDVPVDSPKMSRRHFEIIRNEDDSFSIMDLGSSNGTYLNGNTVNKHSYTPIKSGDVIEISDVRFTFEIFDSEFSKRVSNLPALSNPPQQDNFNQETLPLPSQSLGAKVVKVDKNLSFGHFSNPIPKKKLFIYSFITLATILTLFLFSGEPKKEVAEKAKVDSETISFEKLSEEERSVVRDTFNLARNHFMETRYSLCQAEIQKLHSIIPFYENSKELENLCAHAENLEKVNADKQRREAEKRKIEQRVEAITSDCRQKVDSFSSQSELQECLKDASEFDPEHPSIIELTLLLKTKEEERKLKKSQKNMYKRRVKKGENVYYSARKLYDSQEYSKAIDQLSKYLKASWPDPKNLKSKARRDLASAKKKLAIVVDREFKLCKSLEKDNKLKEALKACDTALDQNPNNMEISEFRAETLSVLRREMKFIYEDSILEESLGNVEAAKIKWKIILKKNLESDDYYRKAKNKLKKYGIGI